MPVSLLRDTYPSGRGAAAAAAVVAFAAAAYLLMGTPSITGLAVASPVNQTNVTLSVASTTSIDVDPDLYNFSKVTVGSTNFSSTVPALNLIIKNEGSNNLTSVYAHTETLSIERDNPLGTGTASRHAAGKFLWIKNDTSSMYHAGFLSWNITSSAGGKPVDLVTGFGAADKANTSWGFYRNASGNYLWALNSSTFGAHKTCNGTSTILRVRASVDTGNNRDLSEGSEGTDYHDYQPTSGNVNQNWGVVTSGTNEPIASGPLARHYAAIHSSCQKFYVFRFDSHDIFGLTDQASQFLASSSNKITPGEEFVGRVGASVPNGIPAGQTNRTLLTIYASTTS